MVAFALRGMMKLNKNIYIIIFGMSIVTYIPRLLPFYMLDNNRLSKKFQTFLSYIPYAALGALIFPGVLSAVDGQIIPSIIGILFSIIYAYYKGGIVVPVLGSIGVVYLFLMFK